MEKVNMLATPGAAKSKYGPKGPLRTVLDLLYLSWEFQESDIPTFILPNTFFGILGALSGYLLVTAGTSSPAVSISPLVILQRFPLVFLYNYLNNLTFVLANQTAHMAVEEDRVNKPWRPIPSGRVTQEQARRAMLFVVPSVLAFNYAVGTWNEGMGIAVLTWMYNDLGGGDELSRDAIIAVAFALFDGGSLRLAVPFPDPAAGQPGYEIGTIGYTWLAIISGVIWTTMQVQDLKDQEGDQLRGRKTIPLLFGERFSRWVIAIFIAIWAVICAIFWGIRLTQFNLAGVGFALPIVFGGYVAFRAIGLRNKSDDAKTWRLWCAWTVSLYLLPFLARLNG